MGEYLKNMSRIGKLPIGIPKDVDVNCTGAELTVKGKFGTLNNTLPDVLGLEQNDSTLVVSVKDNTRKTKALHGLYRTLIDIMIVEVVQNTTITIKSCDKERLGLFAAQIRSWRPPEPYKGKGILYQGEVVLRKAGKSGKK